MSVEDKKQNSRFGVEVFLNHVEILPGKIENSLVSAEILRSLTTNHDFILLNAFVLQISDFWKGPTESRKRNRFY